MSMYLSFLYWKLSLEKNKSLFVYNYVRDFLEPRVGHMSYDVMMFRFVYIESMNEFLITFKKYERSFIVLNIADTLYYIKKTRFDLDELSNNSNQIIRLKCKYRGLYYSIMIYNRELLANHVENYSYNDIIICDDQSLIENDYNINESYYPLDNLFYNKLKNKYKREVKELPKDGCTIYPIINRDSGTMYPIINRDSGTIYPILNRDSEVETMQALLNFLSNLKIILSSNNEIYKIRHTFLYHYERYKNVTKDHFIKNKEHFANLYINLVKKLHKIDFNENGGAIEDSILSLLTDYKEMRFEPSSYNFITYETPNVNENIQKTNKFNILVNNIQDESNFLAKHFFILMDNLEDILSLDNENNSIYLIKSIYSKYKNIIDNLINKSIVESNKYGEVFQKLINELSNVNYNKYGKNTMEHLRSLLSLGCAKGDSSSIEMQLNSCKDDLEEMEALKNFYMNKYRRIKKKCDNGCNVNNVKNNNKKSDNAVISNNSQYCENIKKNKKSFSNFNQVYLNFNISTLSLLRYSEREEHDFFRALYSENVKKDKTFLPTSFSIYY